MNANKKQTVLKIRSQHSTLSSQLYSSGFAWLVALTEDAFVVSLKTVRRLKRSLSWALLALMFAVALTPVNGLTVFHTHQDHEDDQAGHYMGLVTWSEDCDVFGPHHDEGLHAHRIGWDQLLRPSSGREIGAPVLAVHHCLAALLCRAPAQHLVKVPRPSAKSEMVHAPPPLSRSMALLI
jgi:hypothetical protein